MRRISYSTADPNQWTDRMNPDELIVCGWDEVFILRMGDPPEKVWSWKAETCSTLPGPLRHMFGTTDDCKPFDGGRRILITSSGWGVALVDRETKAASFWAVVPNAHSADLLPNNRVAVAASQGAGGNRLIVYDLSCPLRELWNEELHHGHGVVWDQERERLYAFGHDTLKTFRLVDWESARPSLQPDRTVVFPEVGGHELQPVPGTPHLMVSTNRHCWLYNRDTSEILPHPDLADAPGIKSLCVNPRTGQLAYQQFETTWWAERIRFLHPTSVYYVPGEHFYKARWNV